MQEGIDVKELENIPDESEESEPSTSQTNDSSSGAKDTSDDDLSILNDMIQTTQFHHPHHRAFQVIFS